MVPGPPVPLYLAGAKFLTFHPLSIVMHGLALNITIQTYAGHVDFGIVAGKKALPHAQDLARAIEDAFRQAQLLLAPAAPPGDAPVKPSASRAPVAQETTLGKSPSVKQPRRPNTGAIRNNNAKTNAQPHGTLPTPVSSAKKPSRKSAAKPARRTGT